MNKEKRLSEKAKSIQDVLHEKGRTFEVVELETSTRTAQEAAAALGCDVAQIVKSLLFRIESTNKAVLLLVSGMNRVHEQTVERILGEKIVKADAHFTREMTGFTIGGIPPLGHKQVMTHIFIDEDLLGYEKLWAAAGSAYAVFCFPSCELVSLTGGKVIALKE